MQASTSEQYLANFHRLKLTLAGYWLGRVNVILSNGTWKNTLNVCHDNDLLPYKLTLPFASFI